MSSNKFTLKNSNAVNNLNQRPKYFAIIIAAVQPQASYRLRFIPVIF